MKKLCFNKNTLSYNSILVKLFSRYRPKKAVSDTNILKATTPFDLLNEDISGHNVKKLDKDTNFDMSGTAKEVVENFTNTVLPNIENFVERQLLDQFSDQLTPIEKETVKDAYGLRREKADKTQVKKEEAKFSESSLTPEENIKSRDIVINFQGKSVQEIKASDVGKVYILNKEQIDLMYPFDVYGLEFKKTYAQIRKMGIMIRKQGFMISNFLSYIKTPKERESHMKHLYNEICLNKQSLYEKLNSSFLDYSIVYQQVSESLLDFLYFNRNSNEKVRQLFSANDIFEGLVRKILSNFEDPIFAISFLYLKSSRDQIVNQLMMTLFEKFGAKVGLDSFELSELDHRISENDLITVKFFHQIIKQLQTIELKLDYSHLNKELDKIGNKVVNLTSDDIYSDGKVLLENNKLLKDIVGKDNNEYEKVKEALIFASIKNNVSREISSKTNFTFKINKPELICKEKDVLHSSKKEIPKNPKRVSIYADAPKNHNPLYKLDTIEVANLHSDELKSAWFNSSILLHGDAGVGKSGILNYLHLWAKSSGWFVVPVFRATRLYNLKAEEVETHVNGLYLTHRSAKEFLLELKIINLEILAKITHIPEFGKINFAGEKDGTLESFPTLWDEKREVFTDSWKQLPFAESKEEIAKEYPDHYKRISDYIPKPKNLLEIVEFGLDNPRFAHNAIAEVLNAIKTNKDIKSITIIDEYNEMFKPTDFHSFRFANYLHLKSPPYAFALIRLLMNFDGHLTYNGVKVCATSTGLYPRHECPPKKLALPEYLCMKVDHLKLNETRNIINYYNIVSKMNYKQMKENDVLYIHNLTQGNFSEINKVSSSPVVSEIPSYSNYLERKEFLWKLKPKDLESIKKSRDSRKIKESKRIERIEEMRKKNNTFNFYI